MAKLGDIRIGTSGWSYRHWKGSFYPPDMPSRDWLDTRRRMRSGSRR